MKKSTKASLIAIGIIAVIMIAFVIYMQINEVSDDTKKIGKKAEEQAEETEQQYGRKLPIYTFDADNFISKKYTIRIYDDEEYIYMNEIQVPRDFFDEGPRFSYKKLVKGDYRYDDSYITIFYDTVDQEMLESFTSSKNEKFEIVKNSKNEEFYVSNPKQDSYFHDIKIYRENEFGLYDTIEVQAYGYEFDDSYKLLLEKGTITKELVSDYYPKINNKYWTGTLLLNSRIDQKTKIEVDYKVPEKYEIEFQSRTIDYSNIIFEINWNLDFSNISTLFDFSLAYLSVSENPLYYSEDDYKSYSLEEEIDIYYKQIRLDNKIKKKKPVTIMSNGNKITYIVVENTCAFDGESPAEDIFARIDIKENMYVSLHIVGGANQFYDENVIKELMNVNIRVTE